MSYPTRRHFLMAGSTLLASPFIMRASALATITGYTTLPIPPLLRPKADKTITLNLAKGRHSFAHRHSALSAGINGNYLGPTIKLHNGEKVKFQIKNRLGEPTTLHWHGLFVPSIDDGGPHNTISDGAVWSPEITVNQPASLNWYHPHLHGDTARQVHMGMAGLIIIDDGKDRERGLPTDYGISDIPLVLQDRRVINGDDVYAPDAMDLMHGFRGDKVIVNGAIEPLVNVPAGLVRLRFLNGANARIFHLAFKDKRPLHIFASDGGMIDRLHSAETLTIAPGERYEVLVDFSKGTTSKLLTSPRDDGSGEKLTLMHFHVDHDLKPFRQSLPMKFDGPGKVTAPNSAVKRAFLLNERNTENMAIMMQPMKTKPASPHADHSMSHSNLQGSSGHDYTQNHSQDHDMSHAGMHGGRSTAESGPALTAVTSGMTMAINDKNFDMNRIDVEAKLDSFEIWEISTQEMAHPFHIHGASFRILSKNGQPPAPYESGWKDTALVEGKAELLIHFNREGTKEAPFMFHCHVLEHEDLGMMGQFITKAE